MTDPVDDPTFWKGRIYNSMAKGHELHTAVYNIDPSTWNRIQNQCRGILERYLTTGCKMLDAGCGYGIVYDWLSPRWGIEYTGIDISPDLIELGRIRNPDTDYRVGDLRDLSQFEDKQFDLVLCRSVRDMIIKNLGEQYWNDIEKELLRVGKKLLLMEYPTLPAHEVKM